MAKYPNAVPTNTDYPDRQDDQDWIYAERYNEIKNEVLAICQELGVLPKGSYASVRARLDALEAAGVPESLELNVFLNAFRIAAVGSLSVLQMAAAIVDEYEDETGIDAAASTGEQYDPTNDLYAPGYDSYTKLLLHCNGADGSTEFTDEIGHTVTPQGNAQIDTARSKFGGASALLDGSGDYLVVPNASELHPGSGDFTIDMWVYVTDLSSRRCLWSDGDGLGSSSFCWFINTDGHLLFFTGDTDYIGSSATPISVNTWAHVALVRSGTTLKMYINGTEDYSGTFSNDFTTTNDIWIGRRNGPTPYDFVGNIDEIRFSKGVARWTANFTPPSSEYEPDENMTLISQAFTAEEQPDEARIVIFEEDVDSITLNTDLKAYVSRDGGTTWTQITLSDEGHYESGKRILTGTADISSQPAGTSMKYKIETLNNKNLKIHGTALSWA